MTGVSQSTIAKIERSKIKGSYPEVVKLFEALEDEADRRSKRVRLRDISTKKVIGVQMDDPIGRASEIMNQNDISQLPVLDGDRPIGSITAKAILDQMMGGKRFEDISNRRVLSIMDAPFSIVDEDVDIGSIEMLVVTEHAVLTTRNGKITGIVTGADLIQVDWTI